ncbi:acyl-CoA carboxylase subunit epsilon [Microbacterium sp. C7(2022)]|uniref:acyl-CoA carboxylase subunit epsilon n=1 Tax=Microbacterium sp. C7(2022) TaxID=2992759 RepID=UPI00237AADB4|nr:acyl-CoA carboxylase subunit epsilon [Microbacterium sp. C7(2022)]MDE0547335.1 acyl-CoA carboxylase subunit epsilon [Microbacterium sp. C7(2022)]
MSDDQPAPVHIEVLRGAPTEEELAALIAVVREAYVAEAESAVVEDTPARSAWSHAQRGLRQPLRRERGWVHG